jgi:hypothetical protein
MEEVTFQHRLEPTDHIQTFVIHFSSGIAALLE